MKKRLMNFTRNSIVASSLALASSAGFVYADDELNREWAEERFDYIFTELALTDSERAATLDILQAQMGEMREQRRAMHDAGAERPTPEQREALRTPAYATLSDQLETVLQEDQIKGLITYLSAHQPRGRMDKRMGHHGGRY